MLQSHVTMEQTNELQTVLPHQWELWHLLRDEWCVTSGISCPEIIIFNDTLESLEEAYYLSCTMHFLHPQTHLQSITSAFEILCVWKGRLSTFLVILSCTKTERQNQKRDSLLQTRLRQHAQLTKPRTPGMSPTWSNVTAFIFTRTLWARHPLACKHSAGFW